ncbi:hypothetical protein TNIN_262481 [Trichonephila inaurata madagascariensis]|uniref:Uncharacterized protein n=1 Tax=Trichonephila inaurata madagascariensis TaxID=2747483 RepID=A0A8X6ITA5_9ARAC|nr:hypothetical protein TNIN_262481 [Trichonephila inaurata madagascariensis]
MYQKRTSDLKVARQPLFTVYRRAALPENTTWRSATCCPSRAVLSSLTPDIYFLDSPREVESCDIPFTSTPTENGSICLVSKSGKTEQESCVDGRG